ncbi:elongation of very long chain fatty acids protein-like isoform X2, partial [Dinothrombium tinctorium]
MGGGPWSSLGLLLTYYYFIKIFGPKLMKNRKPFDLRWLMIIYNFSMVILSAWMFTQGCQLLNYGLDAWECQVIDYTLTTSQTMQLIQIGWIFFISKLIELLDTIFFVLRKKSEQVTNLHVIHHTVVPIAVWFGLKFAPGGYNTFFPFLNSFVHIIMYFYYGLAAFGP